MVQRDKSKSELSRDVSFETLSLKTRTIQATNEAIGNENYDDCG